MADGRADAERGAEERAREFGAKLLTAIGGAAERARLVAGEPRLVAGPMA